MPDRVWIGGIDGVRGPRLPMTRKPSRRECRPRLEDLEGRALLASLAPIANVTIPANLGFQVPLNGSAANSPQTFTVTSSNPNIKATIASGQFLTLNVTHTKASGSSTDISFSGPITFQLFQDLTPLTVSRIESFVTSGFYNGKVFHRVANGFPTTTDYIVQGGSKSGTGQGNSGLPGTPFPDEFNQQLAFTGTFQLAMANAGPNTNDTQFFITTGSPRFLDFHHTIFGQVVAGQDIVTDMTKVAVGGADGTTPLSPITITTATLSATNPNGVVHLDATHATAGQSSTITVTAHQPSDNSSTTQQFTANVVANTQIERPFVNMLPDMTVGLNQTAVFQIPAVSPTPGDSLTYTIQSGFDQATGKFIPTSSDTNIASATVDQATGIVRVVPKTGFHGTIPLLYGVRDQVNRAGTPTLDDPANYQWHTLTLTVSQTPPNPQKPIAVAFSQNILTNTPTPIQLAADNTNPGTNPTFTFTIVAQPLHGTISGLNANTGALTYTPATNFQGIDQFQYTVTATGGGLTTPLTSLPSTVTLRVFPKTVETGAVRVIGKVLVVTPLPRTDGGTNTIVVTQTTDTTNPVIQVTINNQLEVLQPAVSSINRIVVYGSKAGDDITIDPSVTVPNVTLDGGHGGRNVLKAGSTATREHGWFGLNTLTGGTGPNRLVGRAGHVKFQPTATTNEIFAGVPHHRRRNGHQPPPGGTFYRFVNGRLVPISRA